MSDNLQPATGTSVPKTGPQRRALARTPVENRSRRTGSRPTGNGDRGTATIASEQSTRTPGATTDKNTKSYRDAALKSSTPSEIIKNTGKPAAPHVADLWDAIGGVEETSIKEEPALQITAVKRFLERLLAKIGLPHLPVAMLQGTTPQHNWMATVIIPPRRVSLWQDAEARTQATAISDGETDESSSSDSGDGMCEDDQSVTLHHLYECVRKHVGTWAPQGWSSKRAKHATSCPPRTCRCKHEPRRSRAPSSSNRSWKSRRRLRPTPKRVGFECPDGAAGSGHARDRDCGTARQQRAGAAARCCRAEKPGQA